MKTSKYVLFLIGTATRIVTLSEDVTIRCDK